MAMTENDANAAPATPVANLRETRKEMAAARKRHPAGKQAPAKAPAEAPAKAPAKKAAPTATKPAGLRWTFPNGKDEFKDGKTQIAPFGKGELAILRSGEAWKAVYRVNGKVTETLAEGSFGKCYNAAVKHAKGAAA
jgi:hypothetical protein